MDDIDITNYNLDIKHVEYEIKTNSCPPVQNTQVQPAKSGFPALCKQGPSANTKAGTEYKNMASVPVSETTPKQPWVKTKRMVVIYRQVKNGQFATTT